MIDIGILTGSISDPLVTNSKLGNFPVYDRNSRCGTKFGDWVEYTIENERVAHVMRTVSDPTKTSRKEGQVLVYDFTIIDTNNRGYGFAENLGYIVLPSALCANWGEPHSVRQCKLEWSHERESFVAVWRNASIYSHKFSAIYNAMKNSEPPEPHFRSPNARGADYVPPNYDVVHKAVIDSEMKKHTAGKPLFEMQNVLINYNSKTVDASSALEDVPKVDNSTAIIEATENVYAFGGSRVHPFALTMIGRAQDIEIPEELREKDVNYIGQWMDIKITKSSIPRMISCVILESSTNHPKFPFPVRIQDNYPEIFVAADYDGDYSKDGNQYPIFKNDVIGNIIDMDRVMERAERHTTHGQYRLWVARNFRRKSEKWKVARNELPSPTYRSEPLCECETEQEREYTSYSEDNVNVKDISIEDSINPEDEFIWKGFIDRAASNPQILMVMKNENVNLFNMIIKKMSMLNGYCSRGRIHELR